MLHVANNMSRLSFGRLMAVYVEGNLENARDLWPHESPDRQIMLAEQEFYNYLQEVFFRTPEARYAVWETEGEYVSALRLEPYRDGLLLEALETAPEHRRKGYAKALIQAVLEQVGHVKIYSHVSKRNEASLRTHESCGFRRILDYAAYLDGSVQYHAYTLCHEPEE